MRGAIAILLVPVAAGCSFDGARPTAGNDASSTPSDAAADGQATDAPPTPTLIDRGLVVRYFMDEAGSGRGPAELIDSSPNPVNIPITYGQAVYIDDGNRGLYWANALGDGKVELALPADKVSPRLQNGTRITTEVVVDIDSADGATAGQIAGLRGLNPDLMLTALGQSELRFHRPFGPVAASWPSANEQDRMVLHVVFDTTQADPEQRVELYKNGVLVTKVISNPPLLDSSLGLSNNDELMIGNNQNENQSISGTIYYVAYYDLPLTPDEIINNVERLQANDDR